MQHLGGPLAVQVYEAAARAALEYGDLPEYNQCQARLGGLYAQNAASGCRGEFLAYRLLYQVAHAGQSGGAAALMTTLRLVTAEVGPGFTWLHLASVASRCSQSSCCVTGAEQCPWQGLCSLCRRACLLAACQVSVLGWRDAHGLACLVTPHPAEVKVTSAAMSSCALSVCLGPDSICLKLRTGYALVLLLVRQHDAVMTLSPPPPHTHTHMHTHHADPPVLLQLAQHPAVAHALRVRKAAGLGGAAALCQLYQAAPNLGRALMDLVLPRARFRAVQELAKACVPSLPVPHLAQQLLFTPGAHQAASSTASGASQGAWGCWPRGRGG